MIGPLELVILLVIVLLIFHKRLPGLGRSAGTSARIGGEKAREFADRTTPKAKELAEKASTKSSEVGAKVSDRIDAGDLGRKAGKGMREARDMRAEFKGFLDAPPPSQRKKSGDAAEAPAADADATPSADGQSTGTGTGTES